jgi:CheY-like chemotaxis protein
VILDAQMPIMDGFELAQRLRQDSRTERLPLIMLTSLVGTERRRELESLGIACVPKPVRQSKLYEQIRQVLLGDSPSEPDPEENTTLGHVSRDSPQGYNSDVRILVVEDNRVNQRVALRLLKKRGLSADLAVNGREAIARLAEQSYDLILMDCQMPEMDGFEATRRIRLGEEGGDSRVPIIAMTANAVEGDRERCLAAGMDDYISKPVQIDVLGQALERWIPATHQPGV